MTELDRIEVKEGLILKCNDKNEVSISCNNISKKQAILLIDFLKTMFDFSYYGP